MSSFQLKLIAITSMLIDHTGAVVFPDLIGFRIVGRLAFPLFAFLIAEGYHYTSNLKLYFLRLSIFALISQYPFWLAFGFDAGLNIFFTLAIGLMAIHLHEKYENFILIIGVAFIADLISTDYGMFGVLLIYLMHICRDDFRKMLTYIGVLYIFVFPLSGLLASEDSIQYFIQIFALLSFVFIGYYDGREGIKLKFLFYLFYPVHLLILGLLFAGFNL